MKVSSNESPVSRSELEICMLGRQHTIADGTPLEVYEARNPMVCIDIDQEVELLHICFFDMLFITAK
jgi:hypothetical protein